MNILFCLMVGMVLTIIPVPLGRINKFLLGKNYYLSKRWQRKRRQCFEKYGKRCNICRSVRNLHVHHKTYIRFGNEYISDLIPLCEICHRKEHKS